LLILGEPGARKTIFCSQSLFNGITKFAENGLLVSMDENRSHYDWEMNQFGWNFRSIFVSAWHGQNLSG